MNKSQEKVCARCVMDTSAKEITFDARGYCNFCEEFLSRFSHIQESTGGAREVEFHEFVSKVKRQGFGKKYDCVVGVSGGVDSSWVLVKAIELGLRPLAVHMDNGWNSELAQNNISNLVKGLNVDLVTHVIDWTEYRNMMQAFFDSDVVDVELLYDNAMLGVNYQQAAKFNIKYILGGTNLATEGMKMPMEWNHLKFDKRNIKAIVNRFGGYKLDTFPIIGVLQFVYYEFIAKRKWIHFLDKMDYDKEKALTVLEAEYGYKRYPYKHYESIFTRFYQGYLLPKKFNIDKRKIHFSTLIASEQMSRDEALLDLEEDLAYPSQRALDLDREYFLKKMKWDIKELDDYLYRDSRPHSYYPSEEKLYKLLIKAYRGIGSLGTKLKSKIRAS